MTQTTKVTQTTLTIETPAQEIERSQAASKRDKYKANRDTYSRQHCRMYKVTGQVSDDWDPLVVSEEAQRFWRMIRAASDMHPAIHRRQAFQKKPQWFALLDVEEEGQRRRESVPITESSPFGGLLIRQWRLTYCGMRHGLFIQEQIPLEWEGTGFHHKIHVIPIKAQGIFFQQIRQLLLDQSIRFPEDFEGIDVSEMSPHTWSAHVTCANDVPFIVSVRAQGDRLVSSPQDRQSELKLERILHKRRTERELVDDEYFTFDCKKEDTATSHHIGIASLDTLRSFVPQEELAYIKSESKRSWWATSTWFTQARTGFSSGQLSMIGGRSSGKSWLWHQMVADQMAKQGLTPTGRNVNGTPAPAHNSSAQTQAGSYHQATGRASRSRSKDAGQASKAPGAWGKGQGHQGLDPGPPVIVLDSNDGQLFNAHWIRVSQRKLKAACKSSCFICEDEGKHSSSGP